MKSYNLAAGQIVYPARVALNAKENIFVAAFLANAVKEMLATGVSPMSRMWLVCNLFGIEKLRRGVWGFRRAAETG